MKSEVQVPPMVLIEHLIAMCGFVYMCICCMYVVVDMYVCISMRECCCSRELYRSNVIEVVALSFYIN